MCDHAVHSIVVVVILVTCLFDLGDVKSGCYGCISPNRIDAKGDVRRTSHEAASTCSFGAKLMMLLNVPRRPTVIATVITPVSRIV